MPQDHRCQNPDYCDHDWNQDQPRHHELRFSTEEIGHDLCALTVKLRGRTTTPDRRRGRTLSFGARGAKQTTHHGPLQRLLDGLTAPLRRGVREHD
jgi:hypothetical protein